MTYIQGIELSEDEVLMAQEMGLEDYLYEEDERIHKLENQCKSLP